MPKSKRRNFNPSILLAAGFILIMSSCNRGVGCPSNFSVGDILDIFGSALGGLL